MSAAVFIRLFARQFGLTLAALCLLLQAAVPAGFMATGSASGFPLSIVICGAQGESLSAADLGIGHEDPASGDERPAGHCAFAGLGAGFIAPDLPQAAPATVTWVATGRRVPAFRSPATRTAAAPPPPRGPPSIV